MTDLADLKPKSDTIEVILRHPTTGETLFNEDKTEMSITVYLPHSAEYKAAVFEQTNKRIKKKKMDFTAEDIEEASLTLLAKITKEWNITFGGERPKLSVEKAREIYDEVFWIKAQIEEDTAEAVDFT